MGTLFDLCLDEITTRRMTLIKEMEALSTAMEDDSIPLSEHDGLIYQAFMNAIVLDEATKATIVVDFSENTCDTVLDKMNSDPEIKKLAVNRFFHSFGEYTGELLELENMQMLLEILPFILEHFMNRREGGLPPPPTIEDLTPQPHET